MKSKRILVAIAAAVGVALNIAIAGLVLFGIPGGSFNGILSSSYAGAAETEYLVEIEEAELAPQTTEPESEPEPEELPELDEPIVVEEDTRTDMERALDHFIATGDNGGLLENFIWDAIGGSPSQPASDDWRQPPSWFWARRDGDIDITMNVTGWEWHPSQCTETERQGWLSYGLTEFRCVVAEATGYVSEYSNLEWPGIYLRTRSEVSAEDYIIAVFEDSAGNWILMHIGE